MWSNERVVTFIEDLESNARLWDVHCADYKNRNKKGDTIIFLQKNMKSALSKLRKNRQCQRSVPERA
jgi:ASC-1-like (ASCH) protein